MLLVSGLFGDYFVSVYLKLVGSLGLAVCGVAILVFCCGVWVEIGRHFSETGGLGEFLLRWVCGFGGFEFAFVFRLFSLAFVVLGIFGFWWVGLCVCCLVFGWVYCYIRQNFIVFC